MLSRVKRHKKWAATILTLVLVAVISVSVIPSTKHLVQQTGEKLVTVGTNGLDKILTVGMKDVYAAVEPDYTCDGTADDVQIQAALTALAATGGEIHILAGTYNFTATVSRAIDDVTIRGVGKATYIAYNGSTALFSAGSQDGWTFADFSTDAGGITLSSATNYILDNVWIGDTHYKNTKTSTMVVAASNASENIKSQADYVCDGTADEAQIQDALDAIDTTTSSSGKLVLSEGTFYISDEIDLNSISKVTIEGAGRTTTILSVTNGANLDAVFLGTSDVQRTGLNFRSFEIYGNKANQASGNGHGIHVVHGNSTIEDLYIYQMYGSGIYCEDTASYNTTDNLYTGIYILSCNGAGFDITTGGQDSIVSNCDIGNNTYNIRWTGGGVAWFFNNNHIWGITSIGITVNNVLMDGGGTQAKFEDNSFGASKEDCFIVDVTDDYVSRVSIVGNTFRVNCWDAASTYDEIQFKRDSGTNTAMAFTINNNDFFGTTDTQNRYAINLGGSFTENSSIIGNHFFSSSSCVAYYVEPIYINGAVNCNIRDNTGYISPAESRLYNEQIMNIIGQSDVQHTLWSFVEYQGTTIKDYTLGTNDLTPSKDVSTWDDSVKVQGKVNYYTGDGVDQELDAADNWVFSTVGAFSVGVLVYTQSPTGSEQDLIAKWDETTSSEDREFKFYIDTNGYPSFTIYDEANDATVGRQRQSALTSTKWYLLVGTFDGNTDAAGVSVYAYNLNTMAYGTDTADIADDVGFANVTAGASKLSIGYQIGTAGTEENFIRDGQKFSYPFYCMQELSVDEVHRLASILAGMLGL